MFIKITVKPIQDDDNESFNTIKSLLYQDFDESINLNSTQLC
jgi:hypothetical protein